MIYTQLSSNYKYDTIAEAIHAREMEYFHYDFDRANFEYLLKSAPDGDFKNNTSERLSSTLQQMQIVKLIMDALRSQIDDEQAYAAAVERVTSKRKAKESE
jgi:hypothetical protein